MIRVFNNSVLLLIIFLLFSSNLFAQNWASIGSGLDRVVHCFYEDTIDNVLYVGGSFRTANNDTVSGIFKWNGSEIIQLGLGFDYQMGTFPSPVTSIIRYNNEIYATGFFSKADSIQVNSIAKWTEIIGLQYPVFMGEWLL